MNILPLVMQYFGPVIMNKIAGSLGINSTLAQRAIAMAAPAILAGLVGKVGQPGGAKALSEVITKQDPGLLGRLGEMIGTGKQAAVVEQGTSALGGLFGNSALGSLAGALSKQVGLGAGASNTLLGLMAPAVLGTLGREQKAAGLDATGLADALKAQKKSIADAIPPDFAKLLAGTGLLDGVQGATTSTTPAKPAAAAATPMPTKTPAATPMSSTASKPGMPANKPHPHHHFSWTPWLLAIAASALVWWFGFGDKAMQQQPVTTNIPERVPPTTTLATSAILPDALAKTEIGKQILTTLEETKGAFTNIRDAATAQAALPSLQDASGRFEAIRAQAQSLAPDQKKILSGVMTQQSGILRTAITKILAMPGVSAILKPTLDQLLARVDAISKA